MLFKNLCSGAHRCVVSSIIKAPYFIQCVWEEEGGEDFIELETLPTHQRIFWCQEKTNSLTFLNHQRQAVEDVSWYFVPLLPHPLPWLLFHSLSLSLCFCTRCNPRILCICACHFPHGKRLEIDFVRELCKVNSCKTRNSIIMVFIS